LEYAFSEQGLLDRTVFSSSRTANADDFQRFVVGEHGFLSVYQSSIFYYDREWGEFIHDPLPRSVSPALDWQVRAYTVGAKLDPLARRFDADPFALAEHCSFVLAWSRDGSKLLCHENWTLYVYDVTSSGGQLEASQLMTPDDFDPASYRVAFSPSGTWLALTPTQQGLVIVPAADFATRALDTRVLERPDGTNEWDFFFTSMEDRLIVQRGRQLHVAQLTPGELNPKLQDFDVKLPPVPDCNRSWFPEPSSWCGSPKFRGNLVLSDREDWLAFASDDGTVQVVNLDTGELISLGKQAESCSDNCVQFQ
jgi:WD40 repeat protein